MPEIVWKQGAENDLVQIFADLEDFSEGAGERFLFCFCTHVNAFATRPLHTWNLMIDVIAQLARYPPTATGLSNFVVEG
jgi:hypothetical protein